LLVVGGPDRPVRPDLVFPASWCRQGFSVRTVRHLRHEGQTPKQNPPGGPTAGGSAELLEMSAAEPQP